MQSFNIPLSWRLFDFRRPRFEIIDLPLSRYLWYSLAELPERFTIRQLLAELQTGPGQGTVIRGCPAALARIFEQNGFETLPSGQEALLRLDRPLKWRKPVRYLVRLGYRTGNICRVDFSRENREKLRQLQRESTHGAEPQLKHLFRTEWVDNQPCFVFEQNGRWLGALTVSRVSQKIALTELLVRHASAPQGVMESLVDFAAAALRDEGVAVFSLGEAPFVLPRELPLSAKQRLVAELSKKALFAYNYAGLYQFKNKFDPEWQTVYLCGYPRLSLLNLLEMYWISNLHRLTFFKIGRGARRFTQIFLSVAAEFFGYGMFR